MASSSQSLHNVIIMSSYKTKHCQFVTCKDGLTIIILVYVTCNSVEGVACNNILILVSRHVDPVVASTLGVFCNAEHRSTHLCIIGIYWQCGF